MLTMLVNNQFNSIAEMKVIPISALNLFMTIKSLSKAQTRISRVARAVLRAPLAVLQAPLAVLHATGAIAADTA